MSTWLADLRHPGARQVRSRDRTCLASAAPGRRRPQISTVDPTRQARRTPPACRACRACCACRVCCAVRVCGACRVCRACRARPARRACRLCRARPARRACRARRARPAAARRRRLVSRRGSDPGGVGRAGLARGDRWAGAAGVCIGPDAAGFSVRPGAAGVGLGGAGVGPVVAGVSVGPRAVGVALAAAGLGAGVVGLGPSVRLRRRWRRVGGRRRGPTRLGGRGPSGWRSFPRWPVTRPAFRARDERGAGRRRRGRPR